MLPRVPLRFTAARLSLETLEKREAMRGTSPIGHGGSHYRRVYGNLHYDMEVNTEEANTKEIKGRIFDLVNSN